MSAGNHTLTLPWIKAATSGFVQADAMREAISLAIAAGENLIFSGPGGHGKSEFLAAAFGAIEGLDLYVKSFGQGTSPEELYGGLDFNALNPQGGEERAVLKYCPELSFLAKRVAIFEEAFDAPSRVLTSLKDTLTARALRNGHQWYKMLTSIIAVATNHSPTEIAEGGPEVAALIERFPIQLKVEWEEYTESSYLELFETVMAEQPAFERVTWDDVATLQERARSATMGKMMKRMLARIIVDLREDKIFISPRTAVKAMQIAKAAAAINGRDTVAPQDLIAISFLPGVYALRGRISGLITDYEASMVGEEELERLKKDFAPLRATLLEDRLADACTRVELEGFVQRLNDITRGIDSLRVTAELSQRKKDFYQEVKSATRNAENALSDMQVLQTAEEHSTFLAQTRRDVKALGVNLRNARTQKDRQDTLGLLHDHWRRLGKLNLDPSLQLTRESLYSQIKLATVGHDVSWTIAS